MMNVNVAPDWATATPAPAVIVDNPGPNWERVKSDFEAGLLSIRQIAAREGISDTAIRKRAKAESWFAPSSQSGSHPLRTEVQTTCEPKCEPDTDSKVAAVLETYLRAAPPKEDFSWTADNPDVLIHNPPSLAVYTNPYDHIVMLQDSAGGDEDMFVTIAKRDVPRLIDRLRKLAAV